MSRINENRELLNCKMILEHYKFIKQMNDMSTEEFIEFIYGISPSTYSAFKNKGFKNVKNIISDYIMIFNKALEIMKANYRDTKDNKKLSEIKRNNYIIRHLYLNKKTESCEAVANAIGIEVTHFCRIHIKALKYFADIFNRTSRRLNLNYNLDNNDVRIIEIRRLQLAAEKAQKIA